MDTLLADPGFRAAKQGGAGQRYAEFAIPKDTDKWVGWEATRDAADRAEELAQAQYAQIIPRLDELPRRPSVAGNTPMGCNGRPEDIADSF